MERQAMRGRTAGKPLETPSLKRVARSAGALAGRKIWLPKAVYDALPYFYVGAGIAAFLATLYIGAWFWVLPHYLLFSVACLHLGVVIFRRRDRLPADQSDDRPTT